MSPPPQSSSSLPSSSAAPAIAELVAAGHDTDADAGGEEAAAAAAEAYEREHVHGVYEAIAPHFSSTRYKPWPAVAQFLNAQRPGAVGLDVGCGNGKYLGVNRSVYMVGSDRSSNLVSLARSHVARGGLAFMDGDAQKSKKQPQPAKKKKQGESGEAGVANAGVAKDQLQKEKMEVTKQPAGAATADVLVADGLSLPFRDRSADFVICVAVIHHLSTRVRRQDAIRQLLECAVVPPAGGQGLATVSGDDGGADPDAIIARGGTVLVYVWALEQGSSRRGWDEGGEQDLLVPWVMKKSQAQQAEGAQGGKQNKKRGGPRSGRVVSQGQGQGPEAKDIAAAAAAVTANGGGDSAIGCKSGEQPHDPSSTFSSSADAVAGSGAGIKEEEDGIVDTAHSDLDPSTVFNRYYHLYRKGELEEDVVAAGGVVVKSGYERDNWWVVCAPKKSRQQ